MPSTPAAIHVVGPADTDAYAVARETVQRVFPGVPVHDSLNLAAIGAQSAHDTDGASALGGAELLVLLNPQSGDSARAATARDARGLLRWAVVARSAASPASPAAVIELAEDDWNAPALAQALKSATRLCALERENGRLRGDLRTIGRRLAHDLRTPLNCISTANEALAEPGSDPALMAVFAQSITDAVDEAAALVDRLSVVLLATAHPPELRPVAMEEIVWGALQRLETRVMKAGATIVQPPKWPAVKGVPALIDLIWVNLVANSVHHGGPKPRVELGWNESRAEYRFWIRDSGPGVAPAKRDLLFHPLDRLNELNAPRNYGLSIVQRLVELQGGRCGYETEPAPSGTFFFTLRTA